MIAPSQAQAVVDSFSRIEDQLLGILRTVPYCPEHFGVWSDALGSLLLDSCSLLDSLWRAASKTSRDVTKDRNDLTVFDYFRYFGPDMSRKWLVCWGAGPVEERPFGDWSKTGQFSAQADHSALDWWTAYNNIKHDRLVNRRQANLRVAVRAVAGLLPAILKDEDCRPGIQQARWLVSRKRRPIGYLKEDPESDKKAFVAAETALFTYAVGWGNEAVPEALEWHGPASDRFKNWLLSYKRPWAAETWRAEGDQPLLADLLSFDKRRWHWRRSNGLIPRVGRDASECASKERCLSVTDSDAELLLQGQGRDERVGQPWIGAEVS